MTGDDVEDWCTGAHELGHAFLRLEAGCVVNSVRVGDGLGFFDWGLAGVCHWSCHSSYEPTDREQRLLLAGCLAGEVAEERFRTERGYPLVGTGSEGDYENFRELQRVFELEDFGEHAAQALASEVLAGCWEQLVATIPLLVERGRLTGSAL
jgi:hypothetical protein